MRNASQLLNHNKYLSILIKISYLMIYIICIFNLLCYSIENLLFIIITQFIYIAEVSNFKINIITYYQTFKNYIFLNKLNDDGSIIYTISGSKSGYSNISLMNDLFGECSKLEKLPDISKWYISKVTSLFETFFEFLINQQPL